MSVLAKIGQTKLSDIDPFLPDIWKTQNTTNTTKPAPETMD